MTAFSFSGCSENGKIRRKSFFPVEALELARMRRYKCSIYCSLLQLPHLRQRHSSKVAGRGRLEADPHPFAPQSATSFRNSIAVARQETVGAVCTQLRVYYCRFAPKLYYSWLWYPIGAAVFHSRSSGWHFIFWDRGQKEARVSRLGCTGPSRCGYRCLAQISSCLDGLALLYCAKCHVDSLCQKSSQNLSPSDFRVSQALRAHAPIRME